MPSFNRIVVLIYLYYYSNIIHAQQINFLSSIFNYYQRELLNNDINHSNHTISDSGYDSNIQNLPSAIRLIQSQGFPAETHKVVTEDGYILSLHRIPFEDKTKIYKGPVLIFHGLFGSSDSWLLRSRKDDLAYLLADQGYDVWLGNSRGNTHSRKHISLKPKSPEFWKFGFHEIGYYDFPASIDYILNVTNEKQLFYIGHSMGTIISYILGSTRPEYNDKIRLNIHLSPIYFLKVRNQFQATMLETVETFKDTIEQRGIFEILPSSEVNIKLGRIFCEISLTTKELCLEILSIILGFDSKQVQLNFIPHLLRHFPMGTSIQTLTHFLQIIKEERGLTRINYGRDKNLEVYGNIIPPLYDLSTATTPTFLYYGPNDYIIAPQDVSQLAKILPNVIGSYEVPRKTFNHVDFLWANDAKVLVYNDLLNLIASFSNKG